MVENGFRNTAAKKLNWDNIDWVDHINRFFLSKAIFSNKPAKSTRRILEKYKHFSHVSCRVQLWFLRESVVAEPEREEGYYERCDNLKKGRGKIPHG